MLPKRKFSGDKLRELRKGKNMTQSDLAESLGINRRETVTEWETGSKGISLDNALAIADLFNVLLDDLIEESDLEPLSLIA